MLRLLVKLFLCLFGVLLSRETKVVGVGFKVDCIRVYLYERSRVFLGRCCVFVAWDVVVTVITTRDVISVCF